MPEGMLVPWLQNCTYQCVGGNQGPVELQPASESVAALLLHKGLQAVVAEAHNQHQANESQWWDQDC